MYKNIAANIQIVYLFSNIFEEKFIILDGTVDASTSGGSITENGVNGTLKAGTSGGSVKLNGISGNVDAKTSDGSMEVNMEAVSDYVKLTNSGNTALSLPGGKGYNLKVKANKIDTSGLKEYRGNIDNRNIEGTISNGGPEIEIKTSQKANLTFR